MKAIDQDTGSGYRILTSDGHSSRQTARMKTCGEVIRDTNFTLEQKKIT
jgi:hypothetical protein